ncbi:MAG: efflux RND transporter periplasmic adaptor subunit [Candidatus Eremiobacteraeota bacterium]|nr:efflux RND transporter periplasmic adaptor subunit [Candidatus Eremiobacteraeota bacterium]
MLRISLTLVAVVAALLVYLQVEPSRSVEPTHTPAPVPVRVALVEQANSYRQSRLYTGEVVAGRQTELGFQRAGELIHVLVDEGAQVSRGTVVARLDTRALDARRRELQAELEAAQARLSELSAGPRRETIESARARVRRLESQLELAELKRQRRSHLYDEGAIAREQLDEFATEVDGLRASIDDARFALRELENGTRPEETNAQRARVERVRASLGSLAVEFEDCQLVAPFAGVVSTRHLDEGAVVSPGQPVLTLYEAGSLEARIGLPADRADHPQASLLVDDEPVSARFLGLMPQVDTASGTVTARFAVSDLRLVPGRSVQAKLESELPVDGFWVPRASLVSSGRGLFRCYTVSEQATVETQQVEVLYTETERALVRGTLGTGQQVIVEGAEQVVAGQRVRVL